MLRSTGEEPDGWWSDRFRAVGTTVHVVAHGGPARSADGVRALVESAERCWSRFRADSELVRLNEDAREVVPISPMLHLALAQALVAWRATDGWFDPTVLAALEAAGYDRSFEQLDQRARPVPAGTTVPGVDQVELGPDRVRRPVGLRFDLGGVGKGLLADLAAGSLVSSGVTSACVSVGGDVRVAGVPPEGGWAVPVEDTYRHGSSFTAHLDTGALATSSTSVRRWPTDDGGWAHHLIDPTTGRPSRSGVVSVVVAAAEAWWAESLAKAALLAGERLGGALLAGAGATGWLHLDDGSVTSVGSVTDVAARGRRTLPTREPGPGGTLVLPSGGLSTSHRGWMQPV